jgi:hypothetical protein
MIGNFDSLFNCPAGIIFNTRKTLGCPQGGDTISSLLHDHSVGIIFNTRTMIVDFDGLFNRPAGIIFNTRAVMDVFIAFACYLYNTGVVSDYR